MDISSLGDLSALIDLCRKKNIEQVKIGKDVIELTFVKDAVAPKTRAKRGSLNSASDAGLIEKDLSDEEILLWSSGNLPADGEN